MVPFVAACAFVAFAAQLVMGDHDSGAPIGARPFVLSAVALLVSGLAFVRTGVALSERTRLAFEWSRALRFIGASGVLTFAFGIVAQSLGEGTAPDGGDALGWLVAALLAGVVAALVAMLVAAVPAFVAALATFVARGESVRVLARGLRVRRAGRAPVRWSPSVGNRPPPELRASI